MDENSNAEFVVLDDGYPARKNFYDYVCRQVDEVVDCLIRGERYTLKDLCGPEFWVLLDDGDCRIAGRCMVHIVTHKRLPLRISESKHEYPVYYELA